MSKTKQLFLSAVISATALLLVGTASVAQAASLAMRDMEARVGRLENKISNVQGGGGSATIGSAGQQVRIDELEEQLRRTRGMLEETQHQLSKATRQIKQINEDVGYRLNALEQKNASGASGLAAGEETADGGISFSPPPEAQAPVAPKPEVAVKTIPVVTKTTQPAPVVTQPVSVTRQPINAPEVAPVAEAAKKPNFEVKITESKPAVSGGDIPKFASPREQYNYAFSLMNKAQYKEAGEVFNSFLQRYPQHELRGNVHYWLGETYYVREEYENAAGSFQQGFQEMPQGRKAPDNLLKLSMSLKEVGKSKEACVVLAQLLVKYDGPDTVLTKARQQQQALGCQ